MVADAIRGLLVSRAFNYLNFSRKRAAKPLSKLLKSAVVNATKEKGVDVDKLYIQELRVECGPTMKRWMPRARGMATPLLKRSSHIKMILGEK